MLNGKLVKVILESGDEYVGKMKKSNNMEFIRLELDDNGYSDVYIDASRIESILVARRVEKLSVKMKEVVENGKSS